MYAEAEGGRTRALDTNPSSTKTHARTDKNRQRQVSLPPKPETSDSRISGLTGGKTEEVRQAGDGVGRGDYGGGRS